MRPRLSSSTERRLLQKKGYNPKYFLTVDESHKEITFLETSSGKPITISESNKAKRLDILLDIVTWTTGILIIATLLKMAWACVW